MEIQNWMSWEAGVDIAGVTDASLQMPNIIVYIARMVHTPIGSTPAGVVLIQPDPTAPPAVFGFVCEDRRIGKYFGPKIFAGTPFETAPVHQARIHVATENGQFGATIRVGSTEISTRLLRVSAGRVIHREPGPMPFTQQGVEADAAGAEVLVNGKPVNLILPKVGLSGGAAAVYAPCGIYAR